MTRRYGEVACDFCHGKPVLNAATWAVANGREPKYVPCPRCGLIWDEVAISEYEHADEQAAREEMRS